MYKYINIEMRMLILMIAPIEHAVCTYVCMYACMCLLASMAAPRMWAEECEKTVFDSASSNLSSAS